VINTQTVSDNRSFFTFKTTVVDNCKAATRGSEWRKARSAQLTLEPWCVCCGRNDKLEVHHLVPWHINEELRTTSSNLITLCRECHFRFGHFCNWKDYNRSVRQDIARFNVAWRIRKARNWSPSYVDVSG